MNLIDPSVIVQSNYKKLCYAMKHLILTTAGDCALFSCISLLGPLLKHRGCIFENLSISMIIGATGYYQHNEHMPICPICINNSISVFSKNIFYSAALEFIQGCNLLYISIETSI